MTALRLRNGKNNGKAMESITKTLLYDRILCQRMTKGNQSRAVSMTPRVWHSQKPPQLAGTLNTGLSAGLMFVTTSHQGGQQALERLLTAHADWEYKQPIKNGRKVVCSAGLRARLYEEPPSEPSQDGWSELSLYLRQIPLQLDPWYEQHFKNADGSISQT